MDISMDIHRKSVDMDMDMDGKFHIHGKPVFLRVGRTDLYQILGRQKAIIEFMNLEKDKRCVASF